MPVRTPPHEDCLHFAALLREALQQAKLVDPTQIGELVANAQQYPERQEIPYHPAVIESWLNGRAVPPPAAFEALHDMLADVVPSSFEDAYEAAYLQAPTKNEVGTVLHHRLKEQGLKLYDVGQKLLDAGTSHTGRPYSGGCVSYWCNGVHDVPSHVLLALDQLLPPQDTARIPLGTLVGLNKRQDSAERLAKATTTTDLHRALRYMRQALGFSNQRMADAISDKLTGESHVSNVSVLNCMQNARQKPSMNI